MTYELVQWAQRYPGLTGKQRVVLMAMCDKVDPAQGGFFFKRLAMFHVEDLPDFPSLRSIRKHIASLIDKGALVLTHHGGGRRERH